MVLRSTHRLAQQQVEESRSFHRGVRDYGVDNVRLEQPNRSPYTVLMLSQLQLKLHYLFKSMAVQYLTLGMTVTRHIFYRYGPPFWGTEQGTLLRIHLSKNTH